MSISSIQQNIVLNLKNIPGPTVNRKIVVIEVDDYGGIRMPSAMAYRRMLDTGVQVSAARYNLLDTMETHDDLELLFDVLHSVKDKNGKPAVFSPFVNVANPDFEKIKANGYQKYYYEPFTITLQKYGRDSTTMKVWQEGMEAGLFAPEFHGREHISVQPWMEQLRQGNKQLLDAFDNGFVAVSNVNGIQQYADEFRPEFYFTKDEEKKFLHQSIMEGVKLFEQLFSYIPSAFMPSNSVFHPDFDHTVLQAGISFLVVAHKNPTPVVGGGLAFTSFTFKQKIKKGHLNYYIRNCAFEPSDDLYSSVDGTLQQIAAAFRWNKPAIISSHRVNFAGGLSKKNRDKGLKELELLLKAILKRWPDVEFMSSAKMLRELKN